MRTSLLVVLFVGAAVTAQSPARAQFDLEEATIQDLQDRMASGRDTARSLVEKYRERIEAVDRTGPTLRSVIEVNPDALTIADRLDDERRAGHVRGRSMAFRF